MPHSTARPEQRGYERTRDPLWSYRGPSRSVNVVMEHGREPENVSDPEAEITNIDHFLRMLELNRRYRQKKRRGGSREERLRGLFGGGR